MSTEIEPQPTSGLADQLRRRREAAARCEPLACGHRDPEDCDETCGTEPDDPPAQERDETRDEIPDAPVPPDAGQWWADAKIRFLAREFPKYGTQAWKDLEPDDPRRLAAALDFAEMWRKYGDDIAADLDDANRARPPISSGRSLAELDQAWRDILARNERDWAARRAAIAARPPQWSTTANWPPVAIPGQPGQTSGGEAAGAEERRAA